MKILNYRHRYEYEGVMKQDALPSRNRAVRLARFVWAQPSLNKMVFALAALFSRLGAGIGDATLDIHCP